MIPRYRIGIVHGSLALFAALIIGRAAQVQIVQRDLWAARAERQQVAADSLPAPRGAILDANGVVLAESREMLTLAVAPREVRDLTLLRTALRAAEVRSSVVRRAVDVAHAWVELPGHFTPESAAPLLAIRGIHSQAASDRVYLADEGAQRIVGHTDAKGRAVDGIELALDSILTGRRGSTRLLRDSRGRSFESPSLEGEAPQPGNTVVLTLNHALQDIAEHAIARAMQQTGADGGDIVVLQPHTGEILAMASHRLDRAVSGVPALTDTYEPGSTMKPFIAARLLTLGRARADEEIDTFNGEYLAPGRRTPIRDSHLASSLTLADVIRFSSNVGITRFAERLTPREEYEALRDAGFGTSTGVSFPSESDGRLPSPGRWSLTTPAALAMGYEIAVTPLQLANAYAAIANGGELLEPALVKEIQAPDGTVLYRHAPRVVRRLMPERIAATVRQMLASVVDSGTATDATLATYDVGGKSGTARLSSGHGYQGGAYTASFVALFPADEPQLVVLVKLNRPEGVYYGGQTAGPVSKAFFEAALAASDAALDRAGLARQVRRVTRSDDAPPTAVPAVPTRLAAASPAEAAPSEEPATPSSAPGVVRFRLAAFDSVASRRPMLGVRIVPDVDSLPLRRAVRRLHEAGFQVQLVRGAGMTPAAGRELPAGAVVRLGIAH